MLAPWLSPVMSWLGIGLVPLLIIVIIVILILKD